MTGNGAPPLAGRREWWGLAVLALPTMLTMMDINVLFLALPHLSADLGASSTEQLWITDIYGFLIAGFLVTMGTLGDRIGRRKVLVTGATAFGILSAIAAFSTNPEMLIVIRALLGIAGATIMPSTLALIMGMFQHPKQMGAAIGVWATSMMAGIALGPVVGGLLLASFWWGSVFLLAVPIMVLVLVFGPILLPEFKNPNAGKLDLVSVLLSLLAILPFIWGLKEVVRSGWAVAPVLVAVAGVLFGVVFVVRQLKLANPLLDVRLFAIKAVSGGLILGLLFAAVQGGTGLLVTQHLQEVEGFTALKSALLLLIPAVIMVIGIQLTNPLSLKVRPGIIMMVGMLIAAVGMLVLSLYDTTSGVAVLILGSSIIFLGGSPIGVLVNKVVMGSAPPEKMGSAASLQSTGGELGVALGIAGLGSIATAAYHSHLTVPAAVTGPAADATRESISSAVQAAGSQPPAVAQDLLSAAGNAFTSALNTTAGICAVVFVALAALAFATLRHIPVPPAPPTGPPPEAAPEGAAAEGETSAEAAQA